MHKLTYKSGIIDLCCGMGGLSHAALEAGLAVWAGVDTCSNSLCTYKENFPDALTIRGDIADNSVIEQCLKVAADGKIQSKGELIIVSGPPCQGFSDAGPRCPEDPRNEVLVSVAKAIACLTPKAAFVENVSGLRKSKNFRIVHHFRAILNAAGYHVYSFELNALDFGTPQKRSRMIYFVLPFIVQKHLISSELSTFHTTAKTVREILGDLPIPPVRPLDYDPARDNGSLPNHYAMRHSKKVQDKIASIGPGKGPLSYRKLDPDSHAATLLSGHRAPPAHYEQPRSITTREALRLQGFPDNFRVMGSFGKQMEQVTNAVPAPLGLAILKVILKLLGEAK